jgi:hypothetical protein
VPSHLRAICRHSVKTAEVNIGFFAMVITEPLQGVVDVKHRLPFDFTNLRCFRSYCIYSDPAIAARLPIANLDVVECLVNVLLSHLHDVCFVFLLVSGKLSPPCRIVENLGGRQ